MAQFGRARQGSLKAREQTQYPDVKKSLVELFLREEVVNLTELRAVLSVPESISEPDFQRTVWGAREEVRLFHKIDFAPVHERPGFVHRASPKQIMDRSSRGRRAGLRKLMRAVERMDLASTVVPPEEKLQAERMADHQRTQLLAAKIRGGRLRKLLDG